MFASVAHYLKEHGWSDNATWGREVKVSKALKPKLDAVPRRTEGCRAERALTAPRSLKEWTKLGVRTTAGTALPGGASMPRW